MFLRKTIHEDEYIIRQWLRNKEDCLNVMNKNEYNSDDFFTWLEADDQHGYLLLNGQQEAVAYGKSG